MSAHFDSTKMYTYLKGYSMALEWKDTPAALSFARDAHKNQMRKSGEPYIIHPLSIACHALALGLKEDEIIATAILHDVPEDCGVKVQDLPVSPVTKEAVRRLTHIKGDPLDIYYREISENRISSIVKLLDRCDNVSTMAGVFSTPKIRQYIQETRDYNLPLLRKTKDKWIVESNVIFVLKYHIMSVIDGLEACLKASDDEKEPAAVTPQPA